MAALIGVGGVGIGICAGGGAGCGRSDGYALTHRSVAYTYLYSGNYGSSTLSIFRLSEGMLTRAATTFPTGLGAFNVATLATLLTAGGAPVLYAGNYSTANVSAFAVAPMAAPVPASLVPLDGATGPLAAGAGLSSLAFTPDARFGYAADALTGGENLNCYAVDHASGALSAIGKASARISPVSLVVRPDGRALYVANQASSDLSVYRLDPVTGAPTELPGSPFAMANAPSALAIDASGASLYALAPSAGAISVYALNADAAPLARANYATGAGPAAVAIHPSGKFVFVANADGGTISVFGRAAEDGSLAEIAGSPFAQAGAAGPRALAIDPTGAYLAVSWSDSGTVSVFAIDATTGALAASGAPILSGTEPRSLAFVSLFRDE